MKRLFATLFHGPRVLIEAYQTRLRVVGDTSAGICDVCGARDEVYRDGQCGSCWTNSGAW